jgi:hypothetical protein
MAESAPDRLELAPPTNAAPRPIEPTENPLLIPPPPPVRLLAIADVTLLTPPGQERVLDTLFLVILRFEPFEALPPGVSPKPRFAETLAKSHQVSPRLPGHRPADLPPPPGPRGYKAENFTLHYRPADNISAEQLKFLGIEVPDLHSLTQRLLELRIPYERFVGLTPGMVYLQLIDPAGNVLHITQGHGMPL